ncbi:MAG: hypothetical protein COA82_07000 [Alkaliphilus sp.]|nr:retron Eco8 family effector endonuclease [bacterium AH-315-K05]PHS34829.1 MAG: hypothetical protein COA82_07000 [Alkaliphilus sp.]
MNSFNYLKMLMYIILSLAALGWKNPIILIDEIEIGMHPQFIDLLTDNLSEFNNDSTNLFISTHSPIFVSNLIKKEIKTSIYRVNCINFSTVIEKMKPLTSPKYNSLITMNDASCYFANALVFVEGASEIQLFQNKHIQRLFPKLRYVDIYPFDSNNTKLSLVKPEVVNYNIPYLLLVDMDKIINYTKHDRFKINSDELVNPLSSSRVEKLEKMMFFQANRDSRKLSTYHLKQYISNVMSKSTFRLVSDGYYFRDRLFEKLIHLIRHYCLYYKVFPVATTIEGVIINTNNTDKTLSWIISKENVDVALLNKVLDIDKSWSKKDCIKYRTLVLRLMHGGKLDTLQTFNKAKTDNVLPKEVTLKITDLRKNYCKKASGWIIEFIDYYFENFLRDEKDQSIRRELFKNDFPELSSILHTIEKMV